MCTYLHGPRLGGIYYFRRDIPKHLQPIIGQTAWYNSLRTKDRAKAKELVALETVRTNVLISEAEAALAAGEQPAPAIDPAAKQRMEDFERAQQEAAQFIDHDAIRLEHEREERIEAQAPLARSLRRRWRNSTAKMEPRDAVAARAIRDAEEDAAIYKQRWQILKFQTEQHDAGRPTLDKELPQAHAAGIAEKASSAKPGSVTITGTFEIYGAQDGIAPGTVKQWRMYIKHLVTYLGHDDAARVTAHDLIGWREALRTEKTRAGKPLSSKTINGSYLAAANVTFGYALNQLLLSENPMANVKPVRVDKKPKLRERDFTTTERKAILSAALVPPSKKLSPERALALRWVPWLCAYNGARVNELTQLRAEDVQEIDGVWTIRITPEAGGTKTNEARIVPIHEHLIAQGFLDLVKGKGGPLFYDTTKARGGTDGRHHKKVGMFLASWVRQEVGITDPDVAPNHGWRHTFKTICRDSEIDEGAADYIVGHAHKSQGRKYGSNTLPALSKQLAKFPRYELAI